MFGVIPYPFQSVTDDGNGNGYQKGGLLPDLCGKPGGYENDAERANRADRTEPAEQCPAFFVIAVKNIEEDNIGREGGSEHESVEDKECHRAKLDERAASEGDGKTAEEVFRHINKTFYFFRFR